VDLPPIDSQARRDIGSRAEPRPFGSVEWAVAAGNPAGAEHTVGLAIFEPGACNANHYHAMCEEVVYVLEGEIEHTLGDQSTTLRAGDLFVVPRHAPHRLINRGAAPCRMLIIFNSPNRDFVEIP
jgi:quercetin dioxygenase-like cupin family protein